VLKLTRPSDIVRPAMDANNTLTGLPADALKALQAMSSPTQPTSTIKTATGDISLAGFTPASCAKMTRADVEAVFRDQEGKPTLDLETIASIWKHVQEMKDKFEELQWLQQQQGQQGNSDATNTPITQSVLQTGTNAVTQQATRTSKSKVRILIALAGVALIIAAGAGAFNSSASGDDGSGGSGGSVSGSGGSHTPNCGYCNSICPSNMISCNYAMAACACKCYGQASCAATNCANARSLGCGNCWGQC
jgi:hypothetical protein